MKRELNPSCFSFPSLVFGLECSGFIIFRCFYPCLYTLACDWCWFKFSPIIFGRELGWVVWESFHYISYWNILTKNIYRVSLLKTGVCFEWRIKSQNEAHGFIRFLFRTLFTSWLHFLIDPPLSISHSLISTVCSKFYAVAIWNGIT
jgi:hypothetical protein